MTMKHSIERREQIGERARQYWSTLTTEQRSQRAHRKHSRCGTPEYNSWRGMIDRCENTKAKQYKDYGGRGISVCDEWRYDFNRFLADVGFKPEPCMTIDRIDNDGNYEPTNIRWANRKTQRQNQFRRR